MYKMNILYCIHAPPRITQNHPCCYMSFFLNEMPITKQVAGNKKIHPSIYLQLVKMLCRAQRENK